MSGDSSLVAHNPCLFSIWRDPWCGPAWSYFSSEASWCFPSSGHPVSVSPGPSLKLATLINFRQCPFFLIRCALSDDRGSGIESCKRYFFPSSKSIWITRGSAHWACFAHLTIEWYWSKFQREIIITLKNSSHLEWRVGLSDTILKGTHPGTIYAKSGSIWPSCFRGEDFFNISQSEKRINLGSHVCRPNGTKWRNFIEDLTYMLTLLPSLVPFGQVVSEEKIKIWKS